MTTQIDALNENRTQTAERTPATISPFQAFTWSIRRELWENRSLYIAPLACAGLVAFSLLIGLYKLVQHAQGWSADSIPAAIAAPLFIAPVVVMMISLLVSVFYTLDALYGERRDRSLLFWKSLPVSDTVAVLAKIAIPVLIAPVIGFVAAAATEVLLLVILSGALAAAHLPVAAALSNLHVSGQIGHLILHLLLVQSLWYAPVYGWLLLVSAWARRTPLLWATVPPIVLAILEKIAFGTSYVIDLLKWRLSGGVSPFQADAASSAGGLLAFFISPGLWGGLAFAALCVVAAIRLRRYRDPL